MKENKKKRLQIIASKIKKLESQLALDKNNKSVQDEIERIMCSLDFEEMLYIDNFITKHPT